MNQRRRTTKLATRLTARKKTASSSVKSTKSSGSTGSKTKTKKQSESTDKDPEEMWDEDEKQIHEEEMAAKKAADAMHESNSGDDATKKPVNGEKSGSKSKKDRDRKESTSEKDAKSSSEPLKRVPINLTCVHCKSKCQTSMVSFVSDFLYLRF